MRHEFTSKSGKERWACGGKLMDVSWFARAAAGLYHIGGSSGIGIFGLIMSVLLIYETQGSERRTEASFAWFL